MQKLYILFKFTIWKRLKAILFVWSVREFNPQNKEMIVYFKAILHSFFVVVVLSVCMFIKMIKYE